LVISDHSKVNGIKTANNYIPYLLTKIIIMSGRGDNNKKGSSGRGSSNQSNQAFGSSEQRGKSNHGEQTGGKRSERQPKDKDQSSNRNRSTGREE
jgi:hypothetical protein